MAARLGLVAWLLGVTLAAGTAGCGRGHGSLEVKEVASDDEPKPRSSSARSGGTASAPPPLAPTASRLTDADVRALGLSPAGETALKQLADTSTFGGWAVGYAGTPTPQVSALRKVWEEKNAAKALALVLDKGTDAGQLMALAGLFDADPAAFAAALPRYRGRPGVVKFLDSGCMGPMDAKLADVVEKPNAVRIQGPKDSLLDWSTRNKNQPIELDIAGGGYTAAMRPR